MTRHLHVRASSPLPHDPSQRLPEFPLGPPRTTEVVNDGRIPPYLSARWFTALRAMIVLRLGARGEDVGEW